MTLANTKLLILEAAGGIIYQVDGEGKNKTVVKDGLNKIPDGIFLDTANGDAYITQMGTVEMKNQTSYPHDGSIWKIKLDGSDAVMLVGNGQIRTPKQITGDLANGKLYWSDREGMRVWRSNLDGSNLELLVEIGVMPKNEQDQNYWAVGIAVDPELRQFYYTLKGLSDGGQGRIMRANYDLPAGETPGTRSDLEVLFDHLPEPIDLYLDKKHGYLYWTDRGNLPGGNSVVRATIAPDGKITSKPEVLIDGLGEAVGIDIDHSTGHIFISALTGELFRAHLDGSNLVQIGKFPSLTGIILR